MHKWAIGVVTMSGDHCSYSMESRENAEAVIDIWRSQITEEGLFLEFHNAGGCEIVILADRIESMHVIDLTQHEESMLENVKLHKRIEREAEFDAEDE